MVVPNREILYYYSRLYNETISIASYLVDDDVTSYLFTLCVYIHWCYYAIFCKYYQQFTQLLDKVNN